MQDAFNKLAAEHRSEIMQMRRDRNREGLQELQDKLAAEAESKVGKSGLTDEQLKIYSTVGGTPHLDGQYTVFGEVEEGLDVVEEAASEPKPEKKAVSAPVAKNDDVDADDLLADLGI